MTLAWPRPRRLLLLGAGSLLAAACVVVSTTTRRHPIERAQVAAMGRVTTPVRAHLVDGGMVVFADGLAVDGAHARGAGRRFDAFRRELGASQGVPLDSVLGFEVYRREVNPLRTLVYAPATLAASAIGTLALGVILFGSCPTVYADSAGVPTLQAESFSYSIAPLLAKRDVDRMTVVPDAAGRIRLAVRNEALETHHLDHMEVVELRHRADELALPSPRGGALAASDLAADAVVTDGDGRDVSAAVAGVDSLAFSTSRALLDRAIAGGPTEDHLVISVPRRPGRDSVALVLRARSSLLTTSVLYEHLMGRQGALALDWMGEDLARIAPLAALGTWYGRNFGMRVEVQEGAGWRRVIRLMDFGPTAWRTVGVALPAVRGNGDSVRVRLTFAADAFRVDQLALAHGARRLEQRRIPIARAAGADGRPRADVAAMLARADDREVETHPGDQFWLEFDAGPGAPRTRTFLFAAQGYYVEWLRPSWMRDPRTAVPFSPARTSMRDLLRSWRGGRDSLEALFFTRRVPTA
jgi:hypothetical protein